MTDSPTENRAVTAAELDVRAIAYEQIKRMKAAGESHEMCARWISEAITPAIAALRRERDRLAAREQELARAIDEYRRQPLHDTQAKEIAKKDAALRGVRTSIVSTLCDPEDEPCFDGSDGDRAIVREAIAQIDHALTPASQEALDLHGDRFQTMTPAEKAQAIMDHWRENRPGDWVGDKEYWEAPASPAVDTRPHVRAMKTPTTNTAPAPASPSPGLREAVIEECAKVITDELARMPPDHELTKIGWIRKGMCELLLRDIRALSRPVSEREDGKSGNA